MNEYVYSLSISGRLTLEMHSLNNEGGEGNQILTRTVTLVTPEGEVHKVNAISGDMFKHIQAEHFYLLAREQGLPLCDGCRVFDSARILKDSQFMSTLSGRGQSDEATIDALLARCALDDTEGTLIARGARSIPRKSTVEFSWTVGLPEKVRTESYFHVRYARERAGEEQTEQPIFHRPASSGVYATVATLELARIGFNDISQRYAVDEEERQQRYAALLRSVLYTYVEPNGAMRSTQNPHIWHFEGVVTVSRGLLPAPSVSPLADDYRHQVRRIAAALDAEGTRLSVHEFNSLADFAHIMQDFIENTRPYTLFAKRGG
nr:DevR family CRISPR-associated autoregulator [Ardenticatena sp.]